MAFSLALGCDVAKPKKCCCANRCEKCTVNGVQVCPKSLRVAVKAVGCNYNFFVDCFRSNSGTFPSAVVRNEMSTLTEIKYTEIRVNIVVEFGAAWIELGFFQYWQTTVTMSETVVMSFRQTLPGEFSPTGDCIFPSWRHFPCAISSSNLVCNGISNRFFTVGGASWRARYDLGMYPEPPIWDFTQPWSASLSWV